jgi:fluoroacetyl-CoA thioesterase
LVFAVTATEGDAVVARGTVERVVVDRHRFVERAFRS